MSRLCVLDDVTWEGSPVPGERTHALLRALVEAGSRGAGEHALIEEIWTDALPANPAKALQVVVSRARSATSPDAIERTAVGYRLALAPEDVDAWALRPVGLRLAAEGAYAEALPLLERATPDEEVVTALLRATAAVHGVPTALEWYEEHRAALADRLGIDPSPALQELHRELLASDSPVRSGLRHYASSLVGRDDALDELRGLLRAHRVVSILGPGGLGKTRLAQLAAAYAEQPVVHVVELVGVVDPEDLASEIGSALGVRDSVSGRRVLTPAERSDVRTRIAQQLDQASTLLVLDNCEHLIEAVADLVAFLVTSAPRLRVLTTTRIPLAIAAERVFPLSTLDVADGAELFCQRASAARPGVSLPADTVARIVTRLDGLPLAIELAAVKVRAMSVAEVDVRLENRFALLRGGDRSAPDRHQTLLAVIDWSWNLLDPAERRALRRLSVFHDGFAIDGAEALLGPDALSTVEQLVDSSLLVVAEDPDGVRFRMLETVREFGRMQLVDAGERDDAVAAQHAWAVDYCATWGARLFTTDQVDAVGALRAESTNLADVLRQAIASGDRPAVVGIYSALGGYWAIVGDYPRAFTVGPAVARAIDDWVPPPELLEPARVTLASCLMGAILTGAVEAELLRRVADRIGIDSPSAHLRTMLAILLAHEQRGTGETEALLERLTGDPDPRVRATAYQFLSHERENGADPAGAIKAASAALELTTAEHGPWLGATLHAQLCALHAQIGDVAGAAAHASAALPALRRLGATDDVVQAEVILGMAALEMGRVEEAERIVEALGEISGQGPFGSQGAFHSLCGEVLLARGRIDEGLACFRDSIAAMSQLRFPGTEDGPNMVPWVIFTEASALAAHVRHAEGTLGADLYAALAAKAQAVLADSRQMIDLPVAGVLLFSLGLWSLNRDALPAADALRLMVIADGLSYHRFAPALRWERAVKDAERIAPGMLQEAEREYAGRRGADLLDDARQLVDRLY
ncbi:MAG TPA: BTAD domain-containing putative transcriptional regulator [Nocardioides sp.]|nr:BTAD domain-containing putative transcriptional regulator [Nocardioides sp.]